MLGKAIIDIHHRDGQAKLSSQDLDLTVQDLFRESLKGERQALRAVTEAKRLVQRDPCTVVFLLSARCKFQAAVHTLLSIPSTNDGILGRKHVQKIFRSAKKALYEALQASHLSPECGIFVLQLAWALNLQRTQDVEQVATWASSFWVRSADAQVFSEFGEDFDKQFNSRSQAEATGWAVVEAQRLVGKLCEDGTHLEDRFGTLPCCIAYRGQFVMRAKETTLLTKGLREKWAEREASSFFVQLNKASASMFRIAAKVSR